MKKDLSIKFYPHPTKVKDGKNQVFLRLIMDRKKAEIATDFFAPIDKWETFLKKDKTFDEEQSRIKREIYRLKNRLEDEEKPISAKLIKDLLTNRQKVNVCLVDFFQSYINRIASLKAYTADNVNKYLKTREYMANFLHKQRRVKDVLITEVDFKFLSDFDDYLVKCYLPKLKRTLGRNTANQHHTRLRTLLIRANREGLIRANPYRDFKLIDEVKAPKFLTEEELERIAQHPLGNNPSLQRVRDLFIFCVYTGLRFSDAQKIKANDVAQDRNGDYYLYLEGQQKTDDPVSLPLLRPAVEIFHRYENEERQITGCVLPRISNQKTNTFLKVIADLVGIEKKLTFHASRHTCATIILMSNGVSLEATGKWLGQKSLKSTQIYAKVTNQYLKKVAQSIEDKI